MTDEFDDEHGEEDEAEHVAPAVVDPGGVPKMLPEGYRSINPALGLASFGALVLVVGSALWMVFLHPHPSVAATTTTTTVAHKQNTDDDDGDADAKRVVPDPSQEQLGHLRTHPVLSIVHPQPPARAQAAQTSVSAESNANVVAAAQSYPADARGSGPTGTQNVAALEAQRIADARHASARMQLETQDDPSAASPAMPNGAPNGASSGPLPNEGPNAGANIAAYGPNYPTRTSALAVQVAPQSSEFASDTGGDGSHEAPHQAFLARHDGDPGYQAATSRYELVAGSIIPARLITAIDSTIPGGIIKAQIVEPIFDSATHTVVVIPRGTIALGQADSAMYGEARLVASWTELYLPNGRKFYAAGNQGSGLKGEAGMSASVDTHAGRAFGSALVNAALQAGVTLASRASTLVDVSTTTTAVQAPQRANPTLHAYPGQLFNIVLNHDLPLDRYAVQ